MSRDILDALAVDAPDCYDAVRLHLVERSAAAHQAQVATLGSHAVKLASSSPNLPEVVDGVILANELLDALPTHAVVMREAGLRELYVDIEAGRLVEREGAPSSPQLAQYLERAGAQLEPGWRAEVNLEAVEWLREAARRLRRGFLLLIDYGHHARELYSSTHAAGTLAAFRRHVDVPAASGEPPWLSDPGHRDITAHVDLTSIVRVAEEQGLTALAALDQTYFLLGLGLAERLDAARGSDAMNVKRRLALKTLMLPGGLGSTHKVLIFGKRVGVPRLRGSSFGTRLT